MSEFVFGVSSSLTGRGWQAREWDEGLAGALEAEHQLTPLMARLLASRNVSVEDCSKFLNPSLRACLPDPSLLNGMDEAAARAAAALMASEKIAVFGDYDADGVCSASLMKCYFRALGAEVSVHLPSRMDEGYGLNVAAIEKFGAAKVNLLLIADCGTGDGEILTRAAELGIETIILDHHPADAPPANAVLVNPNCPPGSAPDFAPLAASGLVFLFLAALNRVLRGKGAFDNGLTEPDLMQFLDIAAIGTICDVAPLTGINRVLVLRGLEMIVRGGHPGLAALTNGRIKPTVSTDYAAFTLGPRINAAGRVGHPEIAMNLLCAESEEEAASYAAELDLMNRQRQAIEKEITEEAISRIELNYGHEPAEAVIVAAGDGWHQGVLGITAARLRDRFHRDAFVASFGQDGQGTGSARGRAGSDLGAAVRGALEAGLILKGGGHPAAAGFSLTKEQLPAFEDFLQKNLTVEGETPSSPALLLDGAVPFSHLDLRLYHDFQRAAPFGKGNPEPRLALESVRLMFADVLKGGHMRLKFGTPEGDNLTAMMFRQANTRLGRLLAEGRGELFHIAGTLRPAWRGYGIEMILEDAAPSNPTSGSPAQ